MSKHTSSRRTLLGAVIVLGIIVSRTDPRAAPPTSAPAGPPVVFSGVLTTSGSPFTGTKKIALHLWRGGDVSVASDKVCTGAEVDTPVKDGAFQVSLSGACIDVFRTYGQTWYQLVVDGVAFPLSRVGAAPYAIYASRELSGGTRLKLVRTSLVGSDGSRLERRAYYVDTKYGHWCGQGVTSDGKRRCLPGLQKAERVFADSACTIPLTIGWVNEVDIGVPVLAAGHVVPVSDRGGFDYGYWTVSTIGGPPPTCWGKLGDHCHPCDVLAPGATDPTARLLTLGASVPATEFVELGWVLE